MSRLGLYLHTLRYLKPVQISGRIALFFPRLPVLSRRLPLVRRGNNPWVQPSLRPASIVGSSRFCFLNQEGEVSDTASWNDPQKEKLWLYNLHYFDYLNAKGSETRSDWHRALIARWIAENPVGEGNGWEPYPVSLRIVNWVKWVWAGNELPGSAPESLTLQARFLRQRLEWHILGNHLLANAKALLFAGLFFEGAEAEEWLAKGLSILECELPEQILADGGHFERSPMYHVQVLEDVLDVVNAFHTFPDPPSARRATVTEQCTESVPRMLAWLGVMTHPDGEISLLNDSAFGGATAPVALAVYAERLGIEPGRSPELADSKSGAVRFTHLEATGYIRVDFGEMTAFLDVAPIGPDYLPGHAHADTLSFELSLVRQRMIVDSGVSRYGDGPERLRQRGTAAHNTVEIDGLDSSEVWGGFRVARRAYPRDLRIDVADGIVSCAHDGYRRLPGKPVHRREWKFSEYVLRVHDTIEGGFREAVGRFHFHPDVKIIPSSDACTEGKIVLPEGREVSWHIGNGRGCLSETTWHPEFGISLPNMCLEVHFMGRETLIEFSWK